jgi:hypothetical protein
MATLTSYISPSRSRKVSQTSKRVISRSGDMLSGHPIASILAGLALLGGISAGVWLYPEVRRYLKLRRM